MIMTPSDLLLPDINGRGFTPSIEECREIIAQVSQVEYLIKSFMNFQIDADDFLDGVNDVEMVDTDNYIEGLTLWLPSPIV